MLQLCNFHKLYMLFFEKRQILACVQRPTSLKESWREDGLAAVHIVPYSCTFVIKRVDYIIIFILYHEHLTGIYICPDIVRRNLYQSQTKHDNITTCSQWTDWALYNWSFDPIDRSLTRIFISDRCWTTRYTLRQCINLQWKYVH